MVHRGMQFLSTPRVEKLVIHVVLNRAMTPASSEALSFLFRLKVVFYPLLGQKAVAYGGGVHTWHRHTRYHDFFVSRIKPGERVLDIDCGIGAVAYDIPDQARARVVRIDLSQASITVARDRYRHPNLEFRVHDGTQQLSDGSYDVVVLSNILEHLPERSAFLRRVQSAASPSRILIRVPLFERDWQVPLKKELGVEWRLDPTHEPEHSLESFAEEMAVAGMQTLHEEVRRGEIFAEVVADGS
jgi:2-polyprenyl-3-methyl-5-hydroxy-6-metoxy-1,4-benzoquinol methylase